MAKPRFYELGLLQSGYLLGATELLAPCVRPHAWNRRLVDQSLTRPSGREYGLFSDRGQHDPVYFHGKWADLRQVLSAVVRNEQRASGSLRLSEELVNRLPRISVRRFRRQRPAPAEYQSVSWRSRLVFRLLQSAAPTPPLTR